MPAAAAHVVRVAAAVLEVARTAPIQPVPTCVLVGPDESHLAAAGCACSPHQRLSPCAGSGRVYRQSARLVRLVVMNPCDDYCELCDLPKSQCPHGRPPPLPENAVKASPKPKRPRTPPGRSAPAPDKLLTRRRTPPEAFKSLIVTVLERAGGGLEADELFLELEILAEGRLLPEDRETTPEGELRWRYAARRARVALIAEGLMTKTTPGVWQLAGPGHLG